MKIVIDDRIPYIRGAAERLGRAVYLPGAAIGPDDVRDADALIVRTRTRCDRRLLEGSRVQFVATATIGFDHLDTAWLARAGIAWANCPGCNAASVAQYVESSLILLRRAGLLPAAGGVVGVVGVGHVGTKVAAAARALGFDVLPCDPPRHEREGGTFYALDQLAERADVVTFHTPLTFDGPHPTFHLADEAFFARLRHRPVVMNSGRGEAVDTQALLAALDDGRVRAAVIDTWENEPHIDRRLLDRAFIATPHVAGYSADGKATGTRMALEAVARHFGLPDRFDIRPPRLPEGLVPAADPLDRKLQLYNPLDDTRRLKAAPESFEQLRGNYPLRRERWD